MQERAQYPSSARAQLIETYGVLESPLESTYTDVIRLAAEICGLPCALIGFNDDRLMHVRASHGIDVDHLDCGFGFCPIVIRTRSPLFIEDTQAEILHRDNSACSPPFNVRSYAGIPVKSMNGEVLGSFCVFGPLAHAFSASEKDSLIALGRQVELMLELRRSLAEMKRIDEQRKRLVADLEIYHSVFAKSADAIAMIDLEGRYLGQNAAHERLMGYEDDDLLTRTPALVFGPAVFSRMIDTLVSSDIFSGEVQAYTKSGRILTVDLRAFPIKDESGRPRCYVGIKRDVTEKRAVENRLRESESRFRLAFEAAAVGMAIASPTEGIIQVNASFARILGYTEKELCSMSIAAVTHPDDIAENRRQIERAISGEITNFTLEKRYIRKDGGIVWGLLTAVLVRDENGRPAHFISQVEDITARREAERSLREAKEEMERRVIDRTAALQKVNDELRQEIAERRRVEDALRRSEQQLLQSQKMDAVGKLAGGIAHEFNNLLQVICGHAELMHCEFRAEGRDDDRDLGPIMKAAERASALTRQLLAFSRHQVMKPTVFDVDELIATQLKMIDRLLGDRIEIVFQRQAREGRIKADPMQIEQVLLNLVNNAVDAMSDHGRLVIRTANLDVPADEQSPSAIHGSWIVIEVADNGSGIASENLPHIFDPFFTTKEVGRGTGLGLSTAYGIVAQSGGHILVESEPGRGTTFRVLLPRAAQGATAASPDDAPPLMLEPSGSETVLVVEDDDSVRSLVVAVLRSCGYAVHQASSGSVAIEMIETLVPPVQLLVTDMVMPQMAGRELARRVRALVPQIAVVFMSGHTADAQALAADSDVPVLEKPFTRATIAKVVREALDRRQRA